MTEILLLSLKLSVLALILAVGMDSKLSDLNYLWQRPGLMVRSLVAMYLLVPLVALLMVVVLDLPSGVNIALFVLAVSAGAPLLPRKLMKIGDGDYIFGLVVASSVFAIITVPAWVSLLGPLFDREVTVRPVQVAAVVGKSFLLPLVIGMIIGRLWPKGSAQASDLIMRVAGIVLAVSAFVLLVSNWQVFPAAGWVFILSLALLALASLAIGHMLGGPVVEDRTALGIACATRHVGLAVLVASTVPGPKTSVMVAAYIAGSALVSVPYLKWSGRTLPKAQAESA